MISPKIVAENSKVNKKAINKNNGVSRRFKSLIKELPNSILDHEFVVCAGNGILDTSPIEVPQNIHILIEQFSRPDTERGSLSLEEYLALDKKNPEQKRIRDKEKDGFYIILGRFAAPGTRKAKDVEEMSGFMIDLDQGGYLRSQIEKIMEGTFCIAFTTYSHHPSNPRWRILIPYQKPINPKEHNKVYLHFSKLFDGNLDNRCQTVNQLWYTPACPPDAEKFYEIFVVKGELLNVDTILESVSATPVSHLPAKPNRMTTEVKRLQSALSVIPSDDRSLWVSFGIALKQSMSADVSHDLWMEWSRKSSKFDLDDAEYTWNSLPDQPAPGCVPITLGSIFYQASQCGWTDDLAPMDPAIEEFNRNHFVALLGGKHYVFEEAFDFELKRDVLRQYPLKDIREYYSNQKVLIHTGNNIRKMNVVDVWHDHPDRRTYKNVVFMPGSDTPLDVYNTWRGFAVTPSRGKWNLLRGHILDNICCGNKEYFDYLIKWLAFAVQFPQKPPGVAVVLQGSRGTGKGVLASNIRRLFGSHGMQITQSSHLIGKFNYHLRDCVFLFVDEALWAGDKAGENVLKGLITEEYIQVERKFADVNPVRNNLHIMMASNDDWVVPAGEHERRFFVLNVSDKKMQDTGYFSAIEEQMLQQGGLQAMMYDLLKIDLSNFNVRHFPKTAALDQQKLHSLSPEDTWWLDHLGSAKPDKWKYQPRGELVASFAEHGGTYQNRKSETRLGIYLKKVVPSLKKVYAIPHAGIKEIACYEFPDLEKCKAAFVAKHGFVTDPFA